MQFYRHSYLHLEKATRLLPPEGAGHIEVQDVEKIYLPIHTRSPQKSTGPKTHALNYR